ncbi:MAG: class I adenylate-forming enzyme family protein [Eubacteriales bacterium]|nr:class I adenylate-forming enzyme family protein [Eubacteriales bacterium]
MLNSVALMIQKFAKETPDQIAFHVGDEKCTYETLAMYNRRAAKFLLENGVKPGERVIVESDHILPNVYVWYGIQLLGATFVPLEKNTPSNRIVEIADELEASTIITLDTRDDIENSWSIDRIMPQIEAMDDSFSPSVPDPDSLAEILFTTGTTGKSKGVMVSFSNQINIALAGIETTDIKSDNVWLIPTPMNHAAGLRKCHIAMAVGSTVSLLESFRNFKLYFKTISDHKVTSLYLPPSAIHMLLAIASKDLAALNSQLRFIYSSSTAYPETDKEKMRALLPNVYMYNCFGCSEAGVVCTDEFCVSGGSKYTGSVGFPNSYSEIVVLDEDGNEIENSSVDNPGLCAIRSKSVMQGYWNEPEQTAKALKNGMLVMSDICYFAENGELILVGRSNDTINLGGFKVAPVEVEDVAMRAQCVDECLLVPVSVRGNTALKLLVVLKEGMELDEQEIRDVIAKNLEPYKQPKQIVVIDEIIKTFNGKIDRKQMIAKYA